MPGDRTLRIAVFLNCIGDLPVALLPVLQDTRSEYLVQSRPVRVPLASRYVGNVFMFPQMIDQSVGKGFLAQNRLTPHLVPDGLADAPVDELPVFLLCKGLFSSPATTRATLKTHNNYFSSIVNSLFREMRQFPLHE